MWGAALKVTMDIELVHITLRYRGLLRLGLSLSMRGSGRVGGWGVFKYIVLKDDHQYIGLTIKDSANDSPLCLLRSIGS